MSRYIPPSSTVREDLGDGDFVEIKKSIPWGDLLEITGGEAAQGGSQVRAAMEGLLKVGVAGWGGPGFDELPFGPEALARLRPQDAARIAQLVASNNPELTNAKDSADPKETATVSKEFAGTPRSPQVAQSSQ